MNKWSKVKILEDKPRSGWPLFFNQSIYLRQYVGWGCPDHPNQRLMYKTHDKCVRNVIRKAVSICVIIAPRQKGKEIRLYNIEVSSTPSLQEKKAAHMRTWCQKDLQTL